uniref:Uncharacterized protein n=1 Tax=Meloidogyne incognita TaxID=6306 RepID=A0A914NLF0_MELIC
MKENHLCHICGIYLRINGKHRSEKIWSNYKSQEVEQIKLETDVCPCCRTYTVLDNTDTHRSRTH